jgi:hypothetical protein
VIDQDPYVHYNSAEKEVSLISPTFGNTMRIKSQNARFGSSGNALKELKHVEGQI